MVVTIDGPAGVGKSTVARLVAERLGLRYVDTGAMYRELTAVALDRGVSLDDGDALAALVGEAAGGGTDIRSERVSAAVSAVSRHPQVRERMRARQRELAADAVLEGRDTGTVVCPGADVKVFLTAPRPVRAARRAHDLGLPVEEVERSIERRDRLDAEQSAPATDAVVIDTGGLDAGQVAERVLALVEAVG
jgi:cytidylate kinase